MLCEIYNIKYILERIKMKVAFQSFILNITLVFQIKIICYIYLYLLFICYYLLIYRYAHGAHIKFIYNYN